MEKLLRHVDKDRNTKNAYGNDWQGNIHRTRKRPVYKDSVHKAIPGLPLHFYHPNWYRKLAGIRKTSEYYPRLICWSWMKSRLFSTQYPCPSNIIYCSQLKLNENKNQGEQLVWSATTYLCGNILTGHGCRVVHRVRLAR